MSLTLDLSEVASKWQRPAELLVGALSDIAANHLLAVRPFGISLCSNHGYVHTRLQSVVVLADLQLSFLDRLAGYGTQLGELNIQAPLIMTPTYITESLDTFPLALLEIQQTGQTIMGQDYFSSLTFEKAHVRLQCERVLKVVLIDLRQKRVAAAGDHSVWPEIYASALEECYRVMRALLWLADQTAPNDMMQLISKTAQASGCKLDTLESVRTKLRAADREYADGFYHNVLELCDYADHLPH